VSIVAELGGRGMLRHETARSLDKLPQSPHCPTFKPTLSRIDEGFVSTLPFAPPDDTFLGDKGFLGVETCGLAILKKWEIPAIPN